MNESLQKIKVYGSAEGMVPVDAKKINLNVFFFTPFFTEGNFQYFDYGSKENIVRYGQEQPPQYQLQNISTPIALFYAQNDWLAGPEVQIIFLFWFHNLLQKKREFVGRVDII